MAGKPKALKLTAEEAHEALKGLMEQGPLYQRLTYSSPGPKRYPDVLTLDCEGCGGPQNWQRTWPKEWPDPKKWAFGAEPTDMGVSALVQYKCRNCGKREARFGMSWGNIGETNYVTKFGQQPALEDRIPAVLKKRVDGQDGELLVSMTRRRSKVENRWSTMDQIASRLRRR